MNEWRRIVVDPKSQKLILNGSVGLGIHARKSKQKGDVRLTRQRFADERSVRSSEHGSVPM